VEGVAESPWTPLRTPVFRAIWLATLASNLGTWMHLVAASWLMASLTASAALVALLQTAQSAAAFSLALPGGALADILDRRRMIIATQAWQVVVAAGLGALTLADATTPGLLLTFTFALGVGAALGLPVLWAITPELLPRGDLPSAISLNSAAFTVAQALGPTLGGLLVAAAGAEWVFLLNAVSFLGVVAVVSRWRRPPSASALPPEHIIGAVRAALRYVANARALQVVLLRVAGHVLCFSAFPALLVVVTRTRLDAGAGAYGVLYGCFGAGGAAGAILLARARARVTTDRLVLLAAIVFGGGLVALATVDYVALLAPVLVLAGLASIMVVSSLNIAAQSVLPGWVRGRGLAIYLLTFQGAMAAGAALWGALAQNAGVSTALAAAGVAVVAVHLLSRFFGLRLGVADQVDLAPAPWSEPAFVLQPEPSQGPIRIEIEYRIAPEDTAEFLAAMRRLRRTRRRDGAMQWSVYQDLSDPERHVESFLVSSWAEHERAHERAVKSDRAAIERVLALHRGEPPRVSHLLGHRFGRGAPNLTPPDGLA
jgi:predicted MFS family arabinose efflux permease/quinol monooxygenase YgiN